MCFRVSPNKNLKFPPETGPFFTKDFENHHDWPNVGTSHGLHLEAPPVLPGKTQPNIFRHKKNGVTYFPWNTGCLI